MWLIRLCIAFVITILLCALWFDMFNWIYNPPELVEPQVKEVCINGSWVDILQHY